MYIHSSYNYMYSVEDHVHARDLIIKQCACFSAVLLEVFTTHIDNYDCHVLLEDKIRICHASWNMRGTWLASL